jgi:hypothetical protein
MLPYRNAAASARLLTHAFMSMRSGQRLIKAYREGKRLPGMPNPHKRFIAFYRAQVKQILAFHQKRPGESEYEYQCRIHVCG